MQDAEYAKKAQRSQRSKLNSDSQVEHNSLNAVFKQCFIEIDQQSQLTLRQLKICEHLHGMDRLKFLDRFYFEYDTFFYQNIYAVAVVEFDSVINQW